jgi:hypothetical protein
MDTDQPTPRPEDALLQREKEAVIQRAHMSVVRIVDRTDATQGGSGVLILLDEALFLATAEHVVPTGHELQIVPWPGEPALSLANGIRSAENDLAAFQLDPNTSGHLRDRAIQAGRILTSFDRGREHRALVIGYPGAYMRHIGPGPIGEAESRQVVDTTAFNYLTVTIPENDWPAEGCERPSNRDRDIFLRYKPGKVNDILWVQQMDRPPPSFGDDSPALDGMSGGAVYLAVCRERPIWTAEPILIGLQVSVYVKGGWIRAIQIDRWLDLVIRHNPSLEPAIRRVRTRTWSLREE